MDETLKEISDLLDLIKKAREEPDARPFEAMARQRIKDLGAKIAEEKAPVKPRAIPSAPAPIQPELNLERKV